MVPMLDILTILLIFFIVQTEFKRQINVLKLSLPRTENLAGEIGDRNNVLLEVGADGKLAFAGKEIMPHELPEAVQTLLASTPNARIQVAAADASSMGRFIEVLDSLSSAGLDVNEIPIRIEVTK